MRKIFLLSFDDGTIWDKRFVQLLNKYGIKATFNLNSGLEYFVWHYEDRFPIRRQVLADAVELYRGHEIASHSLHHHWLNTLTPPQLAREVGEDCAALKEIFGLSEIDENTAMTGNFYKCDENAGAPFGSWAPITAPKPDFHRPEYFGKIVIEK